MVEENSTIVLEETAGSYSSSSPTISKLKEQLETQKQITYLTIDLSKAKERLDQANRAVLQHLQHIEYLRGENSLLKQEVTRLQTSKAALYSPPASAESHSWKPVTTHSIRNSLNFPTSAAESSSGSGFSGSGPYQPKRLIQLPSPFPSSSSHRGGQRRKLSFPLDILSPQQTPDGGETPRSQFIFRNQSQERLSSSSSATSTPTFFATHFKTAAGPYNPSTSTTDSSNEDQSSFRLKRSYPSEPAPMQKSKSLIIDTNFSRMHQTRQRSESQSGLGFSGDRQEKNESSSFSINNTSSKKPRLDAKGQHHHYLTHRLPLQPKEHFCNECKSGNPFGFWVRDQSSPDQFLCQVCYSKKSPKYCDLIFESAVPTKCKPCFQSTQTGARPAADCVDCAALVEKAPKYTCSYCSSNTSSGAWYNDRSSSTGVQCQKCYHSLNRIRIDNLPDGSLVQRTCLSCVNFKSTSWYRDAQHPGGYICKLCYNHRYQTRVNDQAVSPRSCGTCSSSSSSLWIKDPSKPGEYLCKRCYHQMDKFKLVVKADGSIGTRDCCQCDAKESSRWYRDSVTPTLYNCVRCYNRRKKDDKTMSKVEFASKSSSSTAVPASASTSNSSSSFTSLNTSGNPFRRQILGHDEDGIDEVDELDSQSKD